MGIIPSVQILGHGALTGAPFCDFLNVSFDAGESLNVSDALRPLIDYCGYSESYPGTFRRTGEPGALRLGKRHKVFVVSASADVCRCFRAMGVWPDFLSAMASFPHRVTMIHASGDFTVSSPPTVVRHALEFGYSGKARFTRKWVSPSLVRAQLGLSASDGTQTGTVYYNKRERADVWARVYDKQEELVSKGFADPGPIVRLEIGLMSDVGATLRDAGDPTALFLHYATVSICSASAQIPQWSSEAQGYVLDRPKMSPTANQRIKAILDTSIDIGRICNLARDAYGADALKELTRLIASRLAQKSLLVAGGA